MLFSCGGRKSQFGPDDPWHWKGAVVTYERLIYENSNMAERGFQTAGLNIQNGKFTAGSQGTYLVTWSLSAFNTENRAPVEIFFRKNEALIGYSETYSYYGGNYGSTGNEVIEQGGRSLYVHLSPGDTLDLWDQNGYIGYVFFCVSLAMTD